MMSKAKELMEKEGLPDIIIKNFLRMLKQIESGNTGEIREKDIESIMHLTRYDDIAKYEVIGLKNIQKLAFAKPVGGLGTSMGLNKAKCLIEVKNGLNFLDIIVNHVNALEKKHKIKTPLVLMNSFSTEKDTLKHLEKYPNLNVWNFKQFKHPKLLKHNLMPTNESPEHLNWNPPGHGDFYPALVDTKTLDNLIDNGYEYIFVSNADNLGAVVDPSILGFIISKKIPFLMEVADRTPADRKGGHLARYKHNKNLLLRESAQCHADDKKHFQDIGKHKFFNTNSLWINLKSLKRLLQKHDFVLPLPLIRNEKNVDPKNKDSKKVYQLETAMGAAIELFDGADALVVPKSRFAPVKKTSDLLAMWSDIYKLTKDYQLIISKNRKLPPIDIILDDKYYKMFDDFKERFEHVPSLINCKSLKIQGDVKFGKNVILEGDIKITNDTNKQMLLENTTIKN